MSLCKCCGCDVDALLRHFDSIDYEAIGWAYSKLVLSGIADASEENQLVINRLSEMIKDIPKDLINEAHKPAKQGPAPLDSQAIRSND